MKRNLVNPPLLAYADYTKPFEVETDSSKIGHGAILRQKQDGVKRVIAYASRSLKPSEINYPAHKLEYLALKWAITEKFHDYLYGSKFEVITYNNPLTYVNTTAKLDATAQRWNASLSNYDFKISYRSGKSNAAADGLSRIKQDGEISSTTINETVVSAMPLGVSAELSANSLATTLLSPESLEKSRSSTDTRDSCRHRQLAIFEF